MTCLRSVFAAALVAVCLPTVLAAQSLVQPLGTTDADLLATQMRQLAASPQDLNALTTAGELSIKLGDLSGAAALFARADRLNPRYGRVKAGMGSILVRSERPGEALRFFAQAESYGWSVTRFAADRGLAYDLIGEQVRAQRDYRTALASGRDDETIRRYALSLGISGRQKEAADLLDPLVRRQDRAGWRARAFVLAMGGDTAGAAKIATTILPAGMAQGLGAFFQRLPTLAPADRAFAVHFGEINPTPERLADARLTPALAPLPVEPAPIRVAAVVPPSERRANRRPRAGREPLSAVPVAAAATPPPVTSPSVTQRPPVVLAAAAPARRAPLPPPPVSGRVAQPGFSGAPSASATTARDPNVRIASQPSGVPTTSAPAVITRAGLPAPVAAAPTRSTLQPVVVAAAPVPGAPAPRPVTPAPGPVAPVGTASLTQRADSVLARIVASLSIPASELGIQEPVRVAAAPPRAPVPAGVAAASASAAGKRVVAEASAKEARDAAVRRNVAAKLNAAALAEGVKPLSRAEQRAADRQAKADAAALAKLSPRERRAAERKAKVDAEALAKLSPRERRAAERKVLADRKASGAEAGGATPPLTRAEKRAAERKLAVDKNIAGGNPARIWVQVAGGANERDLGKAWNAARAKAPALAGRAGYSTPLRATNRVLTGPFKTDVEARAFVNQLAKQGVSGFSFTSEAGQEVTRLGAR